MILGLDRFGIYMHFVGCAKVTILSVLPFLVVLVRFSEERANLIPATRFEIVRHLLPQGLTNYVVIGIPTKCQG